MDIDSNTLHFILRSGQVRWRITSLYSGIECFREALDILDSAVAARFGFRLDVAHALMVTCPKNVWRW